MLVPRQNIHVRSYLELNEYKRMRSKMNLTVRSTMGIFGETVLVLTK